MGGSHQKSASRLVATILIDTQRRQWETRGGPAPLVIGRVPREGWGVWNVEAR